MGPAAAVLGPTSTAVLGSATPAVHSPRELPNLTYCTSTSTSALRERHSARHNAGTKITVVDAAMH
jgi:hypothetical protein